MRADEENTIPAFKRALELGAKGLESDVGLTAEDAVATTGVEAQVEQPLLEQRHVVAEVGVTREKRYEAVA